MLKKSIKMNAVLSVIKQLCSVIFPLITIPYISRVLGVKAYGKVNFGSSVVSYFVLLAGLGVSTYAIREGARIRDKKKQFTQFASEVFTINIISTVIAYVILFGSVLFSKKLHLYSNLIFVQSLTIILTTTGADWINSIYEDYFYITVRYLCFQLAALILMFVFVNDSKDYVVYALITLIATSGGNLINIYYRKRYVKLHIVNPKICKKHLHSVLILFFYAIATTIYVNSDTTILGFIKNEQAVGIYSLSTKIYSVVKQILNAIIIVSLPRLSAYLGEKKLNKYADLTLKVRDALCTLVFPAIVGLFFLSNEIIQIIGGKQYTEGSLALKILCISLGFAVMSSFYCCAILLPYKRDKTCLYVSIICAIVNIVLNFIFIPNMSYNGAALTTLIAEALNYFLFVIESKKCFKIKNNNKKIFVATFGGTISIAIVCLCLKHYFKGCYSYVISCMIFSSIVYLIIQLLLGNYLVKNIIESIRNLKHFVDIKKQ